MIKEVVKTHDRYQFEIKWSHLLNFTKKQIHNVETYLFLPNSLDINQQSYRKKDFYDNLKNYIRFKTPEIPLIKLTSDQIFKNLDKNFKKLSNDRSKDSESSFEFHLKMFCSICKSSIRDEVNFIIKGDNLNDRDFLLKRYIDTIMEITEKFRKLKDIITIPQVDKKIFSIFLFADEYISNLIDFYTFRLIDKLKLSGERGKKLLYLIKYELIHREEMGYPTIAKDKDDNEELIFRRGVLKKYIDNILFLNTKMLKKGRYTEQIFIGIAAGVAMIFATFIAFKAQQYFGNFSYPLFVILVGSYIFKDRIKELLKIFFLKKVLSIFNNFYTTISTNEGDKIGKYQEDFYFIDEKNIPKEILSLRERDHITEIENRSIGEQVICYKKRIKLNNKVIKNYFKDYNISGINDIMRINLFNFLSKMDNPKKKIYLIDQNSYKKIVGNRVYHLNLVIKFEKDENILYKRFRLILNQDGIKRIEKVNKRVFI